MTTARKLGAGALALVGLISVGVSGCSGKSDTKGAPSTAASSAAGSAATPTMSAADLQRSLTARISASTPPKSVTCPNDLTGVVGKTDACTVVVNDTTSVQADVTVTRVNGTNIDYEFTPAMTQAQLEKAFSANVQAQVACDGGLDGKIGSSTTCHVTKNGTTDDATVTVSKVQGLYMSLSTGKS